MVQWFKKVLYFFKKKPKVHMILGFNIAELSSRMEKTAVQIHKHKGDDALLLIKQAIETARNIQILEIQRIKGKDIIQAYNYHLGRLEALSDLGQFIELSLDDEHFALLQGRKKDEPKPRILRKQGSTVGPVI